MLGARPKSDERLQMVGGWIALVAVEAIAWMLPMQFKHVPITADFGQDRSGHDRRFQRITLHQRGGRAAQVGRHAIAIDDGVRGRRVERCQRAAHAGHRRPQDIQRINLVALHEHDLPGQALLLDDREKFFAGIFAQRL